MRSIVACPRSASSATSTGGGEILAGWPPDRETLRPEAQVTSAVDRLPIIVVCAYHATNLPCPMLLKLVIGLASTPAIG